MLHSIFGCYNLYQGGVNYLRKYLNKLEVCWPCLLGAFRDSGKLTKCYGRSTCNHFAISNTVFLLCLGVLSAVPYYLKRG